MAKNLSIKQIAIDKDNTVIVIAVGVAAFVIIFSLVASQALISKMGYQSSVISKKEKAVKDLEKSSQEAEKLKVSYAAFANAPENVLGGNPNGNGDRDGDNPRLVLDALPSKYDFPALTTSLEKVFQSYQIEKLEGTDDEVAQSALEPSGAPTLVDMPFSITLAASPSAAKPILQTYEKSIRPFQMNKVEFTREEDKFKVTVDAKTYFQGTKKFDIKKEKAAR